MITAFIHTHAAKIMKILSDFIAVILFFVAYQITGNMITATTVAVVTGVIQAVYTFAVHKKLAPTQWLSLILVVVFGGLTIWLNDRSFIMLKKTILPWTMASAIGVAQDIVRMDVFFLFLGRGQSGRGLPVHGGTRSILGSVQPVGLSPHDPCFFLGASHLPCQTLTEG